MTIGERIKFVRKKHGLTQVQLLTIVNKVDKRFTSYGDKAQKLAAEEGYRPSNETILKQYKDKFNLNMKLYKISDFGGWDQAYKKYFEDGALFDKIYTNQ